MAEEKKKKDRSKWFREMRSELKKVVWPTASTTAKNTGTVLLCSLVVSSPTILTCLGSSRSAMRSLTVKPLALNEQVSSVACHSSTRSARAGVRLSKRLMTA